MPKPPPRACQSTPGWSAASPARWTRPQAGPPGLSAGRVTGSPVTRAAEVRHIHQRAPHETDTTMSHWEFPGSDPIDVFVDLAAGSVALAARPTDVTTVSLTPSRFGRNADRLISEVRVTFENGRLEVVGPKRTGLWRGYPGLDLTITLPEDSRCAVRTASADITSTGQLAELDAHTASGDITAATVTGSFQRHPGRGNRDDGGTARRLRRYPGDARGRRHQGALRERGHEHRQRRGVGDGGDRERRCPDRQHGQGPRRREHGLRRHRCRRGPGYRRLPGPLQPQRLGHQRARGNAAQRPRPARGAVPHPQRRRQDHPGALGRPAPGGAGRLTGP